MSPNDQETVHFTDSSNTASADNSTYTSADTSNGGQYVSRHNSIHQLPRRSVRVRLPPNRYGEVEIFTFNNIYIKRVLLNLNDTTRCSIHVDYFKEIVFFPSILVFYFTF